MKYEYFLLFLGITALLWRPTHLDAQTNSSSIKADSTLSISESEEEKSTLLFHRLMVSFSPDWEKREMDPSIYPSYFGGAFLSEHLKFVITATNDDIAIRKDFEERINSSDFIFRKVQFPYIHLIEIINKLEGFLADMSVPSNHPVLIDFVGAYPDVVDNRVRVTLRHATDKVVEAFKKDISNSPAVVFEEGNNLIYY